jgi:putative ABC transport system permease protein
MGIIKQSMEMSWKNIKNNRMRSFLTTLGIIIGVTSVIALITIIHGVTDSIMGNFSDLGAGKISVNATGNYVKSGLTNEDIEGIRAIDNVIGVSPTVTTVVKGVVDGALKDVTVEGKNGYYFMNNKIMEEGRGLSEAEMSGSIYNCVIDRQCADTFFKGEDPIGKTIRLGGYGYTVVGVRKGDSGILAALGSGGDGAGNVIVPYKNVMQMTGDHNIQSLELYVGDADATAQVVGDVKARLYQSFNHDENSYSVFDMDSLVETMKATQSMLTAMMGGIASIALFVGGIGIMNMMLVSVTERTREIGLRKALGAEPSRIQLQFLMESIFMSMLGGVIGVVLGLLISYCAALVMGMAFVVQPGAIILGVGFSAAIGIIFGWVPARRASQLNPIDALRS